MYACYFEIKTSQSRTCFIALRDQYLSFKESEHEKKKHSSADPTADYMFNIITRVLQTITRFTQSIYTFSQSIETKNHKNNQQLWLRSDSQNQMKTIQKSNQNLKKKWSVIYGLSNISNWFWANCDLR